MEAKQGVCDTDVIIDYWDQANIRHVKTKKIPEDEIVLDNILISGSTTNTLKN